MKKMQEFEGEFANLEKVQFIFKFWNDYKKCQSYKANENLKQVLPNFLDELESKYKIDFSDITNNFKLGDVDFEEKFAEYTKQFKSDPLRDFKDTPRFSEMQSKESLNPLKIVENLGTDEMFNGKKASPDDDLPEPNTKEGGTLCTDSGDCIGFQLKIMKY